MVAVLVSDYSSVGSVRIRSVATAASNSLNDSISFALMDPPKVGYASARGSTV